MQYGLAGRTCFLCFWLLLAQLLCDTCHILRVQAVPATERLQNGLHSVQLLFVILLILEALLDGRLDTLAYRFFIVLPVLPGDQLAKVRSSVFRSSHGFPAGDVPNAGFHGFRFFAKPLQVQSFHDVLLLAVSGRFFCAERARFRVLRLNPLKHKKAYKKSPSRIHAKEASRMKKSLAMPTSAAFICDRKAVYQIYDVLH